MKLEIPSSHIEPLLKSYEVVNRFRIYENYAVLYYSETPKFKIPVYHAYEFLNTMRKIKKIEVKNNRIYFRFKKSTPKKEAILKLEINNSKLNFSKCLTVVSKFGDVKYFSLKDNTISVIYKKSISYFVAIQNFNQIATISFE